MGRAGRKRRRGRIEMSMEVKKEKRTKRRGMEDFTSSKKNRKVSACHKEILTRLGLARSVLTSLNCLWKDRALSMSLKCTLSQTLVWPVASYGSESWTLKAAHKKRLEAFEMTAYRRMMRIGWTEHRTNQSTLDELSPSHCFLTTIQHRKLKTSLQIYCMVASMVWDLEVDQNGAGQMMWRTGLVYRYQSASQWLETEQHGDPLCRLHCWSSIFRNEEEPTTKNHLLLSTSFAETITFSTIKSLLCRVFQQNGWNSIRYSI